jgi:hypothetical protein
MEAAWDSLLYYVSNQEQLLQKFDDWTSSSVADGDLVSVGRFGSEGLSFRGWHSPHSNDILGVCPSR